MKILIISQYYPPEIGACSKRMSYFADFLSESHEVTVLTSVPNYPDGILYSGYKNCFIEEKINAVNIVRVPILLSSKRSAVFRLLHYGSFVFQALRHKRHILKPNIILTTSPPLFAPLIALRLSKHFRVPFVLDIRDLWPESVSAVGAVTNPFLLSLGHKFANRLYRACSRITVTSPGIATGIAEFSNKISVVLNGYDEQIFAQHKSNPFPHDLQKKKIVLYAGNLGLAQAPEIIVHAARILRNRTDIHFVIIGSGVRSEAVKKLADGLSSITFLGTKPQESIPAYIAASALCLIPYKAEDIFRHTIPSKLFEYMALAKPVIINLKGEASEIIEKAGCGLLAQEENPQSLADAIASLLNDPTKAEAMGQRGKEYAETHFDRKTGALKLSEILMAVKNANI